MISKLSKTAHTHTQLSVFYGAPSPCVLSWWLTFVENQCPSPINAGDDKYWNATFPIIFDATHVTRKGCPCLQWPNMIVQKHRCVTPLITTNILRIPKAYNVSQLTTDGNCSGGLTLGLAKSRFKAGRGKTCQCYILSGTGLFLQVASLIFSFGQSYFFIWPVLNSSLSC